jgi:hypothetical protein
VLQVQLEPVQVIQLPVEFAINIPYKSKFDKYQSLIEISLYFTNTGLNQIIKFL